MAVARSSYSICYMSGAIYLGGGLSNENKILARVERFDVENKEVESYWTSLVLFLGPGSLGTNTFLNLEELEEIINPWIKLKNTIYSKIDVWTPLDPKMEMINSE